MSQGTIGYEANAGASGSGIRHGILSEPVVCSGILCGGTGEATWSKSIYELVLRQGRSVRRCLERVVDCTGGKLVCGGDGYVWWLFCRVCRRQVVWMILEIC